MRAKTIVSKGFPGTVTLENDSLQKRTQFVVLGVLIRRLRTYDNSEESRQTVSSEISQKIIDVDTAKNASTYLENL